MLSFTSFYQVSISYTNGRGKGLDSLHLKRKGGRWKTNWSSSLVRAISSYASHEHKPGNENKNFFFFAMTPPWSELDAVYQKYLKTSNLMERVSSILSDLISKRPVSIFSFHSYQFLIFIFIFISSFQTRTFEKSKNPSL